MNQLDDTLRAMKRALEARRDQAIASGNEAGATKWTRELHALSNPAYARVLTDLAVDPSIFSSLAIYATQKVRRLIAAYLGEGSPDPYTVTLLGNARKADAAVISGRIAKSALSGASPYGVARAGKDTTASTQVSSSRAALEALGVISTAREKEGKAMAFNLEHPLVKVLA